MPERPVTSSPQQQTGRPDVMDVLRDLEESGVIKRRGYDLASPYGSGIERLYERPCPKHRCTTCGWVHDPRQWMCWPW